MSSLLDDTTYDEHDRLRLRKAVLVAKYEFDRRTGGFVSLAQTQEEFTERLRFATPDLKLVASEYLADQGEVGAEALRHAVQQAWSKKIAQDAPRGWEERSANTDCTDCGGEGCESCDGTGSGRVQERNHMKAKEASDADADVNLQDHMVTHPDHDYSDDFVENMSPEGLQEAHASDHEHGDMQHSRLERADPSDASREAKVATQETEKSSDNGIVPGNAQEGGVDSDDGVKFDASDEHCPSCGSTNFNGGTGTCGDCGYESRDVNWIPGREGSVSEALVKASSAELYDFASTWLAMNADLSEGARFASQDRADEWGKLLEHLSGRFGVSEPTMENELIRSALPMALADAATDTCHCGSPMFGSDHCPECGCEQFEATCDHKCPDPGAQSVGDHLDHAPSRGFGDNGPRNSYRHATDGEPTPDPAVGKIFEDTPLTELSGNEPEDGGVTIEDAPDTPTQGDSNLLAIPEEKTVSQASRRVAGLNWYDDSDDTGVVWAADIGATMMAFVYGPTPDSPGWGWDIQDANSMEAKAEGDGSDLEDCKQQVEQWVRGGITRQSSRRTAVEDPDDFGDPDAVDAIFDGAPTDNFDGDVDPEGRTGDDPDNLGLDLPVAPSVAQARRTAVVSGPTSPADLESHLVDDHGQDNLGGSSPEEDISGDPSEMGALHQYLHSDAAINNGQGAEDGHKHAVKRAASDLDSPVGLELHLVGDHGQDDIDDDMGDMSALTGLHEHLHTTPGTSGYGAHDHPDHPFDRSARQVAHRRTADEGSDEDSAPANSSGSSSALDPWGQPIVQPGDGHSAWGCNNWQCTDHPQELYGGVPEDAGETAEGAKRSASRHVAGFENLVPGASSRLANQYVEHRGDKWVVLQKGTGKVLSEHDSEEKAQASFNAMMMNKGGRVAGSDLACPNCGSRDLDLSSSPDTEFVCQGCGYDFDPEEAEDEMSEQDRRVGSHRVAAVDWTCFGSGDCQYESPDNGPTAQVTQDEVEGSGTWSAYVWPTGDATEYSEKGGFRDAESAKTWAEQKMQSRAGVQASRTAEVYDDSRCPACGEPIDYCQGHGPSGDPEGYRILEQHDAGDHSDCNPLGCDEHPDHDAAIEEQRSMYGQKKVAEGFTITPDGSLGYGGEWIGNISLGGQDMNGKNFVVRGVFVEGDDGRFLTTNSIAASGAQTVNEQQWRQGRIGSRRRAVSPNDEVVCPDCGYEGTVDECEDPGYSDGGASGVYTCPMCDSSRMKLKQSQRQAVSRGQDKSDDGNHTVEAPNYADDLARIVDQMRADQATFQDKENRTPDTTSENPGSTGFATSGRKDGITARVSSRDGKIIGSRVVLQKSGRPPVLGKVATVGKTKFTVEWADGKRSVENKAEWCFVSRGRRVT